MKPQPTGAHVSVAAEPDRPAPAYTFDNDDPVAAERLGLSSAVLDGFTISRLSSLGDLTGRRCLEVGAGNGSIAGWLARPARAYETIIEQIVDARAVHLEWPWQVHAAMVSAGLVDVDTAVHARSWPGGSAGALYHAATISQLRTRILEAGMTGEQLDRLCGFLRDPRMVVRGLLTIPTVGRRTAS